MKVIVNHFRIFSPFMFCAFFFAAAGNFSRFFSCTSSFAYFAFFWLFSATLIRRKLHVLVPKKIQAPFLKKKPTLLIEETHTSKEIFQAPQARNASSRRCSAHVSVNNEKEHQGSGQSTQGRLRGSRQIGKRDSAVGVECGAMLSGFWKK